MAELASITRLPQPRVSTHLAKLREASLVRDRRAGVQSYYRVVSEQVEEPLNGHFNSIWGTIRNATDDALLEADAARLPEVLAARAQEQKWADTVAGDMERHYSPGRTWEATARALIQLVELGDVLDVASGDGVLSELLAPRSRSVTCVDLSEKVVRACRTRLKPLHNVSVEQADMHALPFADDSFDVALLMHALTYTRRAGVAVAELARVLRPGGRLVATTLNKHKHEAAVRPYDHQNLGFSKTQLKNFCAKAGLTVDSCAITSREARAPHFEVITLSAHK